MEKIYNQITDFLNTLLNDDWKSNLEKGVFKGNYILDDDNGDYCFRVPGATRGGFKIDENGIILSFHVNYDRVINGQLGCYTVNSKELEKLLTEKFVGLNIKNL